jgi:hypothetical protein
MSMHQPTEKDRRQPEGILLTIMNHVSERIEEVEKRHEERYSHLERKITALTDSVNSWMDKEPSSILDQCERMLDECIPTSPDNPDAEPKEKRKEHRQVHAKWMEEIRSEMQRWKRIREKAIDWAVIGGLGIVAVAVWQYVIRGPH